jgi:outer membrane protein assembly factor BamB
MGGTNSVPLPWFPFDPAEVAVYPVLDLDNAFIFDDLNVNYSSDPRTRSSAFSPAEQSGSGDAPGTDFAQLSAFASCDDYGKRFYFSSIAVTSGVIHLTLTNTVAGFQYAIQRTPTLASPAWTQVQTFYAAGFVAVVPGINAGANQSGFFRAALLSDPLGQGWTNLLDSPVTSSAATAGDCTAFISSANYLYALDFTQGNIKWIVGLDNSYTAEVAPSPAVALDNSAVFVPTHDGSLLTLRPADGHLLRSNYLGDRIFASPAISPADGTVYVVSGSYFQGDPWLFALNPATGATNWIFQSRTPLLIASLSDASVAVGPDCMIYFVGNAGDLYAVHPDGSLAWFFPFLAGSIPQSSPAIDSAGNILIGSADGYVYCLNSSSGGLKWLFNTGDGQAVCSPAIGADSTVYAATAGGSLFAITNGVLKWKYTAPDPNGSGVMPSFVSSPAVNSNNVVIIGASDPTASGVMKGLFVVTNGALKKFYPTVDGIIGSPLLARDNVIIADLSGRAYKFPGAGYPAPTAPWPQFRRDSRHTGATPNPICAGSTPLAFPNNPTMSSDGSDFSFYLTGTPGTVWGISASTNLVDWTAVGGVGLDATGDGGFTNFGVAGFTNRFYRAHCGPHCTRIIGFINQTLQPGANLIANHFFQVNDYYYPQNTAKGWTDLLIGLSLDTPPDTNELRKWNGAGFDSAKWNKQQGRWDTNADLTLLPGQAFFMVNPSNQPVTLPFMGLLAPDAATNSIVPGGSFLSSLLPKAGRIHTDLGFNPKDGDRVLLWQTDHYSTNTWTASGGWSPGEPSLRVGEGFLLLTSQTNLWAAPSPTCPAEIIVPSNPLWTDSCSTVTNGDVIRLTSLAGIWSPDDGTNQVGPNGTGYSLPVGFLTNTPWASLIAFVGPNPYLDSQGNNRWHDPTYFPRPSGTNYYFVGAVGVFTNTTLGTGKLWYGFNDDAPYGSVGDNTGYVHGYLQITHP